VLAIACGSVAPALVVAQPRGEWPNWRLNVTVSVDIATDLDRADEVIRATLDQVDAVVRLGSIRARSIDDGVVLSIRFWHRPRIIEGNDAIDGVVRAIHVSFADGGINFAPSSSIRIEGAAIDQVDPST
jgi:small-conductance mechanosensitive channel